MLMTQYNLHEETKALLDRSGKKLTDISRETGIGIYWLSKFNRDFYDSPGVQKVQQLHDYLQSGA